ncbi:MAG: N-6 DNA methylase, partial [Myxococcota bacterium]
RPDDEIAEWLEDPQTHADALFVPVEARWSAVEVLDSDIATGLSAALAALDRANPRLGGALADIDCHRGAVPHLLSDSALRAFVDHMSERGLRDEELAFPELLGPVCLELLDEWCRVSSTGPVVHTTPESVARLMLSIAQPAPDMRLCDPCCGTGSLLIQAGTFMEEYRRGSRDLALYGQESDPVQGSLARIIAELYDWGDAHIRHSDAATEGLGGDEGDGMRFDRVVAHVPPALVRGGLIGEMAEALWPDGLAVVLMPRAAVAGGDVGPRWSELLDRHAVDTVIDLGLDSVCGDGPAALVVLRAPDQAQTGRGASEQPAGVLFITAGHDPEAIAGLAPPMARSERQLAPEIAQRIIDAWRARADVPGLARVVLRAEIADNGDVMDPRHYLSGPTWPGDVRAHVVGGVPKVAVHAALDLLVGQGYDPHRLLRERGERYVEFIPDIADRTDLGRWLADDPGVAVKHRATLDGAERWWQQQCTSIVQQALTPRLPSLRARISSSFAEEIGPLGPLERWQAIGVVTTWWDSGARDDLYTVAARGISGLLQVWIARATEAVLGCGDIPERDRLLVEELDPEYLDELRELMVKDAELSARAAGAKRDDGAAMADEATADGATAERATIDEQRSAVQQKLRVQRRDLAKQLEQARAELDDDVAEEIALDCLYYDFRAVLE